MIVHSINVYTAQVPRRRQHVPTQGKYRGENGTEEHRRFIFQRSLQKNPFEVGDRVKFKGATGQVIDVGMELEQVIWDGLRARFIEVWLDQTMDTIMAHPSELRKL